MIYASQLLKGFQVLLLGWFPLELAMLITVSITTRIPSKEMLQDEIYEDLEGTPLNHAGWIFIYQWFVHLFTAFFNWVSMSPSRNEAWIIVVEIGIMILILSQLYLLI